MTDVPESVWELYPFLSRRRGGGGPGGGPDGGPFSGPDDGPFSRPDGTAADAVAADATASAHAKIAEITALRRTVVADGARRMVACATALAERFAAGGRLFAFGNGGSSTDAQGLATTFLHPPGRAPALPALSLTSDAAVVTALSNDVGFEVVFARQLAAFGRRGDIAVGLSTSGGSANVVRALEEAAGRGMVTVALAGHDGGRLAELPGLDHLFVMPSASVHRIQEAQTTVYHVLWELTRQALAALRTREGGAR
ncbi:SIS domain-containing protein [Streptomyces sp. NPDC003077]|uniref:D-sedoheptulose-7-phosphate isomerase n=1 Tax=Streptomyces sp. NPDC003077 TaxID=3154443 RepID=UPI0033A35864